MAPVRLRGGKRFAFASQCKVKVHSTAVCAVSREKYDLMWLAVGVRNVRIVRIVRTGEDGGAAPVKGGVNRPSDQGTTTECRDFPFFFWLLFFFRKKKSNREKKSKLADGDAGGHIAVDGNEFQVVAVFGGEEHTLRFDTADFCRFKVGDDDDSFAGDLFR